MEGARVVQREQRTQGLDPGGLPPGDLGPVPRFHQEPEAHIQGSHSQSSRALSGSQTM